MVLLIASKTGRLILRVLLLSLALGLFRARQAQGRWDVPQTLEPVEGAHSSSKELISGPAATPTALPAEVQVPILMYHYISELPPNPDRYRRDLTVLPENFRAQLQYLADNGYHTVTLTDVFLHLKQGYPLAENPIVLTFDDGYRDAYEVAYPMLLEYGYTGTFFVLATPTHFESPDYMTWAQIAEMAEAGMEIQSHGRDHVDLRNRSNDYLVYQIVGIQEAIHHHTGRLPRFFCYPAGQYDGNVIAVLKSAGYWGAVTTAWGTTHTQESLFEMPRIRIRGSDTVESLANKLGD